MTVGTFESNLAGEGLRIGIVQARFNADIGHGLLSSCLAELKRLGVADEDILHITVPGALEIPGAIAVAADGGEFDAYVREDIGEPYLKTLRCRTCGIMTHWEPLTPPPHARMGVNARLLEPAWLAGVEERAVDGASW